MYGVRCALPLTPRALPRCTTALPHRYHGCTARALPSLAGWQAGWPGTPEFAEWRGAKIQISRNEGGTQNTEITGVGDGLIDVRNLPFSSTVC